MWTELYCSGVTSGMYRLFCGGCITRVLFYTYVSRTYCKIILVYLLSGISAISNISTYQFGPVWYEVRLDITKCHIVSRYWIFPSLRRRAVLTMPKSWQMIGKRNQIDRNVTSLIRSLLAVFSFPLSLIGLSVFNVQQRAAKIFWAPHQIELELRTPLTMNRS